MIKKLCIEKDLANALQAFLSRRRIPLGKNPGLQLRDVGEDLRRIVRKVNVSTLWDDIITSVGQLQVCAGRESRCEAAVHTRYKMYSEEKLSQTRQKIAKYWYNIFLLKRTFRF